MGGGLPGGWVHEGLIGCVGNGKLEMEYKWSPRNTTYNIKYVWGNPDKDNREVVTLISILSYTYLCTVRRVIALAETFVSSFLQYFE